MIVEGEPIYKEGDQCPFRSLPKLQQFQERMRLSDGGDIILEIKRGSNTKLLTYPKMHEQERDVCWESGLPMSTPIRCKGKIYSEEVDIKSLYEGISHYIRGLSSHILVLRARNSERNFSKTSRMN